MTLGGELINQGGPTNLALRHDMSVAVLTGAGVSAESGISTFRDSDGLWSRYDIEKVGTLPGFLKDPEAAWKLYSELRKLALRSQPNPAHLALARLEKRLRSRGRFTLVTQNVDGLHRRAGNENVLPIHGSLFLTRCSNNDCASSQRAFEDLEDHSDTIPLCPECGAPLRPDVVLFGEPLDMEIEMMARRAVEDCDVFIAVGTSGAVFPAAGYVSSAASMGARTVLVNLEPAENIAFFNEFHQGQAGKILPALLDFHEDGV
ncbi:MAG: NAD-dependent deacylase [Deltaproteobacteria bacterium]|nr:NAD-dependent deacylase [Deltaproteobacteria bacterium]